MRRDIFTEDHDLFRSQVRRFVEKEVAPKVADWNARGMSDRDTWRRAGAEGLLGVCAPAEFGGAGATSSMRRSSTRRWRGYARTA
jgi:acyl-CoA dehydrogenase/isovaleryl-CoA dehydrogenase